MNLITVANSLASTGAKTLVLFAFQADKKPILDCKGCGCDQVKNLFDGAVAAGRFKASPKETLFFRSVSADAFENVLLIGLGDRKAITDDSVRSASAVAVKTLAKEKVPSAVVCLQSLRRVTKTAEGAGRAMAEGFILGAYKYDELKSKKKDEKDTKEQKELKDIFFALADKAAMKKFAAGFEQGRTLAECTNFARDLGNAPSNYLTPSILAKRVQEAVKGLPVKYRALERKEIESLKMGCFLGVNKGSDEEPRFLILEYFGGKKSDKPLVLVGKGITFDTGGISIKPSASMEEMKFDMCGAAAVIGAFLACAKLKLKKNIVALVPSTENMPGGHAIKPGDVLVAMNGKTVEVNNTDAEGRLILADALVYACEKYEPSVVIDAATLTGACVVALGNVFSGFFCKDKSLLKQIETASGETGESLWQLPLTDDYVDDMKGTYADLSNIASAKGGGSSHGAAFLSQFVDEKVKWAHFDIAGSAWNCGNRKSYNPDKGATGVAVRLFTQMAMDLR